MNWCHMIQIEMVSELLEQLGTALQRYNVKYPDFWWGMDSISTSKPSNVQGLGQILYRSCVSFCLQLLRI